MAIPAPATRASPSTHLAPISPTSNDFFDQGDTFAGTGRLALHAALDGTRIVATGGDARLSDARFRRIALGNVAARWETAGRAVNGALNFGAPAGEVRVAGRILPATSGVDLRASARDVDLATWLPMLGLRAAVYRTPRRTDDALGKLSGHRNELARRDLSVERPVV